MACAARLEVFAVRRDAKVGGRSVSDHAIEGSNRGCGVHCCTGAIAHSHLSETVSPFVVRRIGDIREDKEGHVKSNRGWRSVSSESLHVCHFDH
jgi:hypothetical protein